MLYSALVWPTLQVSYKKDAKASLHYTTVADRPDIKKATQAAKLISEVSRHITVIITRQRQKCAEHISG